MEKGPICRGNSYLDPDVGRLHLSRTDLVAWDGLILHRMLQLTVILNEMNKKSRCCGLLFYGIINERNLVDNMLTSRDRALLEAIWIPNFKIWGARLRAIHWDPTTFMIAKAGEPQLGPHYPMKCGQKTAEIGTIAFGIRGCNRLLSWLHPLMSLSCSTRTDPLALFICTCRHNWRESRVFDGENPTASNCGMRW